MEKLIFRIRPNFEFEINENQLVKIKLEANYLQGKFEQNFEQNQNIEYQSMMLGGNPSYQFTLDDFSIKAGLGAYYVKEKNEK